MKLPDRLYYPLDKAAKKLSCDVSDIIHLAANGFIALCFKCIIDSMQDSEVIIDFYPCVDEDELDKFVRDEDKSGVLEIPHRFYNSYFSCSGVFKISVEDGRLIKYQFVLERYMGLIEIGQTDIYRNESAFLDEENVSVGWLSTPRDHKSAAMVFFENTDDYEHDYLPFLSEENQQRYFMNVVHEVSKSPSITIDDLVITHTELNRISNQITKEQGYGESPKTASLKGDIIRPLIRMLPDFNNVDLDSLAVSKIKDMVEAIAAEKGVEFPEVHRATWQKYLGRNRMVK